MSAEDISRLSTAAPSGHSLQQLRSLLPAFLVFSFIGNLSVLVSPLFMMQVLDRVVPSGNLNTLVLLLMIAALAVVANAAVSWCRDMSLARTAYWVETQMTPIALAQPLSVRKDMLEDLSTFVHVVGSGTGAMVLGAPWVPFFVGVLWLLHPGFALFAIVMTAFIVAVALLRANLSGQSQQATAALQQERSHVLAQMARHGRLSGMMGLGRNLSQRYLAKLGHEGPHADRLARFESGFDSVSGIIQTTAQIGSLAIGAGLVATGSLSAGGMIGASILMGKTIATIDGLVTRRHLLSEALRCWRTLNQMEAQGVAEGVEIPNLEGTITAENLIFPRGGGAAPRLDRISFQIEAGACLAILGESGSGKTTLLHALCGIDPAPIGSVRMGDVDLRTLPPSQCHREIGYLPQMAELLPGSLAENISCFAAELDSDRLVEAARLAGIHGLVSSLPDGYQTMFPEQAYLLSAGQVQRVALARAVYHRPKFLFLDEPNALLDGQGEKQLADTLGRLKQAGTTIVMVVHRAGIIGLADKLMVMERGQVIDFGPAPEVFRRIGGADQRLRVSVNQASLADLEDWVRRQFSRKSDGLFRDRATRIASEMFAFAAQNGPDVPDRFLTFTFQFRNEVECELSVAELGAKVAQQKITKVRDALQNTTETPTMSGDEKALANVIQLADRFIVASADKQAAYRVELRANAAEMAAQAGGAGQ